MSHLHIALARIRALFRRDGTLDEIHEELHWHVQMRTEERNALLVLASASLLAV
jgi:hypothetical protein